MSKKPLILTPPANNLFPENRPALPKVKSVAPYGSKILVEVVRDDEIIGSPLYVGAGKGTGMNVDGAPQAYIIKIGPQVPTEAGLTEGMRVYWTGKGTAVEDPNTVKGRTRAMLEISNILGIIEEDN